MAKSLNNLPDIFPSQKQTHSQKERRHTFNFSKLDLSSLKTKEDVPKTQVFSLTGLDDTPKSPLATEQNIKSQILHLQHITQFNNSIGCASAVVDKKFNEKAIKNALDILKKQFGVKINILIQKTQGFFAIKPCSNNKTLESVLLRIITELTRIPKSFLQLIQLKEIKLCDEITPVVKTYFNDNQMVTDMYQINGNDTDQGARDQLFKILALKLLQTDSKLSSEWKEVIQRVEGSVPKSRRVVLDIAETWYKMDVENRTGVKSDSMIVQLKAQNLRNMLNKMDPDGFGDRKKAYKMNNMMFHCSPKKKRVQ